MTVLSKIKAAAFATVALGALSACTDADITSPGEGAFNGSTGGGTGGGTGGAGGAIDLTPASGCPAGTSAQNVPGSNVLGCQVSVNASGAITQDLHLITSSPAVYWFDQPTFVGTDDGTTPGALGGTTVDLTIDPGAILVFVNPTDFLTVNRGSRILANGTAAEPIVFTSDEDLVDNNLADDSQGSARGQWGGLIINGRAPINSCADPSMPATCETSGEGGTGNYGGPDANDDSGNLNYVRVQYAGFEITTDNELNGIAFQGVGDTTEVDYVQVHNNDDDGVEFFGGTVDVKHLVITGVDDDGLDWVAGWDGSAQDVLIIGSGVGDNGFEGDSNSSNNDIQPRSNPLISNFTLIGDPAEDLGMQIRVGTGGLFLNGIVTGWADGCLDIDDAATHALIQDGADVLANGVNDEDLQISSVYFSCATAFDDTGTDPGDITTAFSGIFTGASTLSGPLPGANEDAVTALDPSTFDTFFDAESFVGAFEPGLTPTETWAFGWTVPGSVFPSQGCPTGTTDITATSSVTPPSGGNICELSGTLTSDVTLTIGNHYSLGGAVFVGQDVGPDSSNPNPVASANLTIQAGVTVFGANPTDFLVVNRGSQILATGTEAAPIVFTSDDDLLGSNVGDERGQWGGLILNGRAPINSCADPSMPASCETSGEGGTGSYGGDLATDSSGILNYVRVQHAGFEITTDNELNGIAFQGVGNGTNVDYIQVHANDDDGIEFFGGTVDASHVVITGVDDDAIDWVSGWNGTIQYALIVGSGVGDNGFEGDSNSSNNNILPRSNPIIANWTAVGGASEDLGMQIRVGTAGLFVNGVVTGWEDGCLDVDDAATAALIQAAPADVASDGVNDEDLQIDATYFSCATAIDDITNGESLGSFGGITTGVSSLVTGGGSSTAILNGGNENGVTPVDPTALDSSLTAVTQIGAVGTPGDNWFEGWTKSGSF